MIPERRFLASWAVTCELEGGGKIVDLGDGGGLTRYGITQRWHRAAWLSGPPSLGRATDEAWDVWRDTGCSELPRPVDSVVFDWAFNAGMRDGGLGLQRALAALGLYAGAVDGLVGPVTQAAARKADPVKLALAVLEDRAKWQETHGGGYRDAIEGRIERLRGEVLAERV